jgi:DNA-binding IclR family transcriptional regulator
VTGRELVAALPMSKATVYRIIKHLVEHEYLVRTPDLTGFMLGVRVLNLARAGAVSIEDRQSSPGAQSGRRRR